MSKSNDVTYSDTCVLNEKEKREIRSAIEQLDTTVFQEPIEKILQINIRASNDTQDEKVAGGEEVINRGHYIITAMFQRDIVVSLQHLQSIQNINQQKILDVSVIPRQSEQFVAIVITWSRGIVNTRRRKVNVLTTAK